MNRKLLSVAVMGAVLASAYAGTARADDRDWHDHEVRAYHHFHPHPHPHQVVVEEAAPVVYAPPVIVAAPPPPPMGINLILPLHFN